MDEETLDNWRRVEEALRKAGFTNTSYYKRAVSIINSGHDPLDNFLNKGTKTDEIQ